MFKFLVATISQSRTLGLCSIVMCFLFLEILIPMFPKVATKCIRVSSTATNKAVIETLIEKFRPDMKMLEVNIQFMLFKYFLFFYFIKTVPFRHFIFLFVQVPEYALYEIHESGERRLGLDEKPLLVQLNWHRLALTIYIKSNAVCAIMKLWKLLIGARHLHLWVHEKFPFDVFIRVVLYPQRWIPKRWRSIFLPHSQDHSIIFCPSTFTQWSSPQIFLCHYHENIFSMYVNLIESKACTIIIYLVS